MAQRGGVVTPFCSILLFKVFLCSLLVVVTYLLIYRVVIKVLSNRKPRRKLKGGLSLSLSNLTVVFTLSVLEVFLQSFY